MELMQTEVSEADARRLRAGNRLTDRAGNGGVGGIGHYTLNSSTIFLGARNSAENQDSNRCGFHRDLHGG